MNITRLSVSRPVTTLMVMLAAVLLGWVAWRTLPLQLLPDLTVPTIGVFMNRPGSSPNETLEKLTKPVEGIIAELPRVKRIDSVAGPWGTWIKADFESGTDIRFVTLDLEERITSFQQGLDDRRTIIEVVPFSTEEFKNTVMFLSLEGPDDDQELLRELVRTKVEPALSSVSGVAKIEIGGLTTNAADVTILPDRLASYGLEFGSVLGRIQAAGTEDTFLGSLKLPEETYFVRLDERVRNVDELRRIKVDREGIVSLDNVALVEAGDALDGWVYRSNGKYALGLQINREEGENLIEIAGKLRTRVEELNAQLPEGVTLEVDTDIAQFVQEALDEVQRLALQGALLALLVPLVFFRSWRIAGIIFVAVPVCVVSVFNLFALFGMTLNLFSIIGLALGVGMLVDNSIVVVENSFRLYFSKRLSAFEAAATGGDEVGRALFASTLTSVVPFVPFLFLEGEFALFVREPTLALVFPLVLSLVVALTLAAMLTHQALRTIVPGSARALRAQRRLNPAGSRLREGYRLVLKAALRHRGGVLLVIAVVLAFTFLEACKSINEAPTNRNEVRDVFRVWVRMPAGNTTSETSRTLAQVEARMAEHPDIKRFGAWFSGERANMEIELFPPKERPSGRTLEDIRGSIIEFVGELPGAELTLRPPDRPTQEDTSQMGARDIIELKALERLTLEGYAARLIEAIELHPDVTMARVMRERDQPEYQALVDRDKTNQFRMNAQTLGQYTGITRSSGQVSSLVLKDGEKRTDVTLRVENAGEKTLNELRDLPVYTQTGTTVGFGELTRLRTGITDGSIQRIDRQASLQVEYFWRAGADKAEITRHIRDALRVLPNPAGVAVEFGGQQKRTDQQHEDFTFVLVGAVILIYVVMAAVFESFWIPFVILLTNPLMMIGIVMALAITGLPFDELAGFGVILLNGVAVNNGIVMMDTIHSYREQRGFRRLRAVFQSSDQRLRPILMTFLTTFLGLLPMAITGEEDSQWRPVAVTVIGGLSSATLLTLVVLPCFYMIGDDFVEWAGPGWVRFLGWNFRTFEWAGNTTAAIVMGIVRVWAWRPVAAVKWAWRWSWALVVWTIFKAPRWLFRTVRTTIVFTFATVWSLVGDLASVARDLWRGAAPPPPADDLPIAHPASASQDALFVAGSFAIGGTTRSGDEPAPIDVSNLRVVHPVTWSDVVMPWVPRRGTPIGHAPRRGLAALDGVTLAIEPGMFGLLGPNGAGKTTLMRAIAGLLEPTRGSVRLFGESHREAGERLAPLVGYLPQTNGLHEEMTLYEYLDFFATWTARTLRRSRLETTNAVVAERLQRLAALGTRAERDAAIRRAAEEVHLEEFLGERLGAFSGGMKRRAGIARILLQAPPILIVDEPTAGLDPVERVKVRLLLARLAESRTVLFSTHIVEDLETSCRAVGVLQRGRLLYAGPPDDLRRRWNERIWRVPLAEADAERVREGMVAAGARVLFRYAQGDASGWRVASDSAPWPNAQPAPPTLEDALLGTLDGARRAAR